MFTAINHPTLLQTSTTFLTAQLHAEANIRQEVYPTTRAASCANVYLIDVEVVAPEASDPTKRLLARYTIRIRGAKVGVGVAALRLTEINSRWNPHHPQGERRGNKHGMGHQYQTTIETYMTTRLLVPIG